MCCSVNTTSLPGRKLAGRIGGKENGVYSFSKYILLYYYHSYHGLDEERFEGDQQGLASAAPLHKASSNKTTPATETLIGTPYTIFRVPWTLTCRSGSLTVVQPYLSSAALSGYSVRVQHLVLEE